MTDLCHCGRPVKYGFDGNPNNHRGMCSDCDLVRCDAYPDECPYPPERIEMNENTPPCPKLGTKHMPHRFLHYDVVENEDGVVITPIPVICDGSPDYFED